MIPQKISSTIILLTIFIFIEVKSDLNKRHKNFFGHSLNLPQNKINSNEPNYIFLLPENQTLVLRKSDFDNVIYPNVTNLNKFTKNKDKIKDSHTSESVATEKLDNFSDKIDNEENYENIIKENVQTERNFVNFIEDMNYDLSAENVKTRNKIKSVQKSASKKKGDDWSELGLDGWEGAITGKKKKNITKTQLPSYEIAYYTDEEKLLPPYHHHIPPTNKNQPKKQIQPPGSQEITDDLPKELQLLIQEERKLYNIKQHTSEHSVVENPQWPITSSRDAHKDEDVFIARANNPFGHSTKWKYRSSNATDENTTGNRSKRGAIKCSTGCDPLVFKGYGCYCGFLGSGYALDGIDRCCKMHDYCYETANCPSFLEYFVPYLWKCYRGKPVCAYDHGEYGGPNSCAARLCQCDLILANCLRRFYCPHKRNVCISNPLRLIQNLAMVF
uniref:CSON004168 protein n=1 Tax=Culicoides sonorensis TaxID=179676 RepID=A0A336MN24_CULSO